MFLVPDEIPTNDEEEPTLSGDAEFLALKPMSCPAHVQIFNQGIKSYRDLPIRMAEFGCCHRNEPHGALHGLMRVRQMTQDDAHIFCREDQITDEIKGIVDLLHSVYSDLGFDDVRDPARHPARGPRGFRRDLGQRRAGARGGAPRRSPTISRWRRAKARSTGRSSNST